MYTINEEDILTKPFSVSANPKPVLSITPDVVDVPISRIDEDMLETTRKLLSDENVNDFTVQEIKNLHATAEKMTVFTKSRNNQHIVYEDGTERDETIVTLRIVPEEPLRTLQIIEHIPKEFAGTVRQIIVNEQPTVLDPDPVIMWHLEDVSEPVEITYTTEKSVDLTGNTVLLAETVAETKQQMINWKLVAPLVLIPLIALLVIYFERFSSKKK